MSLYLMVLPWEAEQISHTGLTAGSTINGLGTCTGCIFLKMGILGMKAGPVHAKCSAAEPIYLLRGCPSDPFI